MFIKWEAICPRCRVKRFDQDSFVCPNCGGDIGFNGEMLQCRNKCGYGTSGLYCSCGARISVNSRFTRQRFGFDFISIIAMPLALMILFWPAVWIIDHIMHPYGPQQLSGWASFFIAYVLSVIVYALVTR